MSRMNIDLEGAVIYGSAIFIVGSATLFTLSTSAMIGYGIFGKPIPRVLQQCLTLGAGFTVGGTVFACGVVASEDYRIESQHAIAEGKKREAEAKKANSMCVYCRYFDDNWELQCAVHPATVCTEAAKNCPDFS
ncbi:hypothetical protein [Tolypothrix sp. VBCCA 56010]|uniref:hypothetical protein n=1 Tax=Tolypothrix sp. VBCCA 56010 TaxID=3137731 RepID=UPI003D7CEA75